MIITAWVLKALVGVIFAGVACCFWDAIRDSVASWLRNSKRENSWGKILSELTMQRSNRNM